MSIGIMRIENTLQLIRVISILPIEHKFIVVSLRILVINQPSKQ